MKYQGIDGVIVSGGNIQRDFALDLLENLKKESLDPPPLLAAADRGLEFFMENHLCPDLVVGDFDSLSPEGADYLKRLEKSVEVLRLKPEKDDSDTQSALNLVVQKGAKNVLLLGISGNRIDHFLANLGLLSLGRAKGVRVSLVDAWNYMTLVESGTVLKKKEQFGKFVSFFPVGGPVEGLTLTGFQYRLQNKLLTVEDSGLTVSNEIVEEEACVTFRKGSLVMIMSRDGR
ncbi:MAG: thiamine diphosphokinase [Eubacteriales bacterium]|nr:thiamine diphosphokinase [Eubacteriales bacterium]